MTNRRRNHKRMVNRTDLVKTNSVSNINREKSKLHAGKNNNKKASDKQIQILISLGMKLEDAQKINRSVANYWIEQLNKK